MPIRSLSLKNFKCFKEVDVDFSRITLLTGANSSGKSSLIYALLGMFQSEQFPFYYSPNGDYVNMGGYKEIVFGGNEKLNISLDLRIVNADRNPFRPEGYNTGYKMEVESQNSTPIVKKLNTNGFYGKGLFFSIEIKPHNSDDKYFFNLTLYEASNPVWDRHINSITNFLENKGCLIERANGRIFITKSILDIKELFSWGNESPNDFGDLLKVITQSFKTENDFNFISSYRNQPERTYYSKPKAPLRLEKNGNGYVDQIIEWQEQTGQHERTFEILVTRMQEIGLLDGISSLRIEGGRAELRVKVNDKGIWSPIADVGFGVRHFLPIIVADLQLNNDSILAVSQPENDLHPSVQAKFGDYLTRQVNETRKQYIIETHSEYIINRLRLNIAKGELKSEDVSVFYLENAGSIAHKVTFAKDGQIKGAPKGFFETYMIPGSHLTIYLLLL